MKTFDLIIIGGGSAGLAAALSAYDNGIEDILILEKENCLGGILQQCIHNGFGLHIFKKQLSGPEYAQRYIDMLNEKKIKYKLKTAVVEISRQKDIYYTNEEEGVVHIKARAIIMATGCIERTSGSIQLEGDRPSGIITAGVAQKYLNIDGYLVGKKVFILGSGDIGLIMARRFMLEGAKVLGVAEIMPHSSGLNRNIAQCLHDFDIPLYLSHTVKKVIGKDRVEKVIIAKVDSQFNYIEGSEIPIECDTLLLSVGLIPYNVLLENIDLPLNLKTRGVDVDEYCQSMIPGIFACGNTLHVHDLADYVSEEAYVAGIGAAKYIRQQLKTGNMTKAKAGNGINYIIPQHFNYDNIEDNIIFKFRPIRNYRKCVIEIKADDAIIKKVNKQFLFPAEMEMIKIDQGLLKKEYRELSFEIKEAN